MKAKLKKLEKESPAAFAKALEIAGIQFLTWCNNGSTKTSRKPPIKTGALRGSSSVFVGKKLIGLGPGSNTEANKSYSASDLQTTWGWNTEYATKMHETDYNLGDKSAQDGDSGNKWLEQHLKADRENWLKLVALETKKGLGT